MKSAAELERERLYVTVFRSALEDLLSMVHVVQVGPPSSGAHEWVPKRGLSGQVSLRYSVSTASRVADDRDHKLLIRDPDTGKRSQLVNPITRWSEVLEPPNLFEADDLLDGR